MSEVGNPAKTFVTPVKLLWTHRYLALFTAPAYRSVTRPKRELGTRHREPELPDHSGVPVQNC